MSEWRSIDDVTPRNGMVLLYGHQIDNKSRDMVHAKGFFVFTGYWDDIDSAWCATGSDWEGPFYHPTHWMPLPAPPVRP